MRAIHDEQTSNAIKGLGIVDNNFVPFWQLTAEPQYLPNQMKYERNFVEGPDAQGNRPTLSQFGACERMIMICIIDL